MSGDLKFFLSAWYKRCGFLKHPVIRRVFFFLSFSGGGGSVGVNSSHLSATLALPCLPGLILRPYIAIGLFRRSQTPFASPRVYWSSSELELVEKTAAPVGAPTRKPRFPKPAPRRARKSSPNRHSCHGTKDAPQASSFPRGKWARGRRLPPQ